MAALALTVLLFAGGCAKYNTYFNAKRAFDNAEQVREEALRQHKDPSQPSGTQKADYESAIDKAQRILDEYPGHSLTDDALFMQAKAYFRLESHRMSIRKFDLLFTNFPATEYLEEAIYLQALNYLLLDAVERSQEYLEQLERTFPDSRFQAETRKVSGDNAYALEDWEQAAASYREYLELDVDQDERDRIGLKLAQCFWELDELEEADRLLAGIVDGTQSAELGFRARLLRVRVKTRVNDTDGAFAMIGLLRDEAAIYKARGDVGLAEAEALMADGRSDEAATLLQGMPDGWLTPIIKAKVGELLGYMLLERGELDKARAQLQTALTQKMELEDPDRTRRMADSLKDYVAAQQALPDAKGDQVPRLKLLQANAMLFGFGRPATAAELYWQAAADTAADSTLAARALYGAYVAHAQHLDDPDSAAVAADRLLDRYPASPQAFEVSSGQQTDLLGYLLAKREETQRTNLANLSVDEREALESLTAGLIGSGTGGRRQPRLRRRQVYLSRREHLVFPPPAAALQALNAAATGGGGSESVAAPSGARSAASPVAPDGAAGLVGPPAPGAGDPEVPARIGPDQEQLRADPRTVPPDSTAQAADGQDSGEEDETEEEDKKRELEDNWDFLRSPVPGANP